MGVCGPHRRYRGDRPVGSELPLLPFHPTDILYETQNACAGEIAPPALTGCRTRGDRPFETACSGESSLGCWRETPVISQCCVHACALQLYGERLERFVVVTTNPLPNGLTCITPQGVLRAYLRTLTLV